MTRTEVIHSLAAQAEIPQIEAGKFMEIFLQKLALSIKDGEEFHLPTFGSFRLLRVSGGKALPNETHIIAVFHADGFFGSQDDHVFRLPSTSFEIANQLDLYFSLSINKPLIPSRDDSTFHASVPSSPLEFKKYAEYRADEIITLGEFRRSEYEVSEMTPEQFLSSGIGASTVKEWNPHVTWEFGDDWKKEYEVESLLETDTPEQGNEFQLQISQLESEPEDVSWDFGGAAPEEESPAEIIPPVQASFSPVTARTRELEIDLTEFQDAAPSEEDAEPAPDKMEAEEEGEEDFDAVFRKSMAANVLSALPFDSPPEPDTYERVRSTRELPEDLSLDLPDETEQKERENVESIVLRPSKGTRILEEKKVEATGIRGIIETGKRTSKSLGVFWKTVIPLAFFIGCVIVYSRLYGKPAWVVKAQDWAETTLHLKKIEKLPDSVPLIIERDYDLPIAYPYPLSKKEGISKFTGDSTVSGENLQLRQNTKLPFQRNQSSQNPADGQRKINTPAPQSGNPPVQSAPKKENEAAPATQAAQQETKGKTIQVMSVTNEQDAQTEVEKLRQKGYDASFYKVDLGPKGIWYRITRKGK